MPRVFTAYGNDGLFFDHLVIVQNSKESIEMTMKMEMEVAAVA